MTESDQDEDVRYLVGKFDIFAYELGKATIGVGIILTLFFSSYYAWQFIKGWLY